MPNDAARSAHDMAAALMTSGISLIILAAIVLVFLIAWWRIWAKAGYSGALGLLMIIPFVNLIMILVLAFSEWPVQSRLKAISGGTTPTV